jgi:hypothetical protein
MSGICSTVMYPIAVYQDDMNAVCCTRPSRLPRVQALYVPADTEVSSRRRNSAPSIPPDINLWSPQAWTLEKLRLRRYGFVALLFPTQLLPSCPVKPFAIIQYDAFSPKPCSQRPAVRRSLLRQSHPPASLSAPGGRFPASMDCLRAPTYSLFFHVRSEERGQWRCVLRMYTVERVG